MPNYGSHNDEFLVISGSAYLFPSGALHDNNTAVSSSVAQVLAITCSSNLNNRLTPSNNTGSYYIINLSNSSLTGSIYRRPQKLIVRYISGAYSTNGKIKSVTPKKYIFKSNEGKTRYVDVPLQNNDDSYLVAFKTVNALAKAGGQQNIYSASLVNDGSFYSSSFSSSLGLNLGVGSSFKIRNSGSINGSEGIFLFHNKISGSVSNADFSGSMVDVGGMMIGSSLKVGGSTQLFTSNIIQGGSGSNNKNFYKGEKIITNSSIGFKLDPQDKTSAMITGSNISASMYFSSSGRLGFGTSDPQSDFDVVTHKFQIRQRNDARGVLINEFGDIESFNKTTSGAATGSEFIMKYSRGGTGAITAALVATVMFNGDTTEANSNIADAGGLDAFLSSLSPDDLQKLLNIGEELGILGTRAQTGDVLGSLRWVADSGSFDQKYFDGRGNGEMLKIQGRISEATELGVRGDMIFFTTTNVANPPTEVMRIGSDGNVHITGSLIVSDGTFTTVTSSLIYSSGSNIFGDETADLHTFTGSISASGNISIGGGITSLGTRINANQIGANGNVGNTEYGYLNGVTSAIQTQLNSKLPLAGGTMTGPVEYNSQRLTNVNIDSGTIDGCNITVGSGDTLELREAGTINFSTATAQEIVSSADGAAIDNCVIGGTTAVAGTFTNLTATGNSVLGNAASDTHTIIGNITASGAISASGVITANTFIGTSLDISGDADIDGTMEADAITLGGATVLAAIDEDAMGSNSATTVPTQQSVKAYVDARKSVLRNQSIYVNDSPFIQNSLYFGHSTGNQPLNWNDPQAIGGDPMTVSSFNISDDDQKWGMIIPYDISKIEILCGLRPGGTHTDQFSLVLYTASRITGNVTAITLTRVAQNGVNFDGSGRYTNNDLTHTADIDAGTMIYVGVGTNTSSPVAKNAPGYMSITITQR